MPVCTARVTAHAPGGTQTTQLSTLLKHSGAPGTQGLRGPHRLWHHSCKAAIRTAGCLHQRMCCCCRTGQTLADLHPWACAAAPSAGLHSSWGAAQRSTSCTGNQAADGVGWFAGRERQDSSVWSRTATYCLWVSSFRYAGPMLDMQVAVVGAAPVLEGLLSQVPTLSYTTCSASPSSKGGSCMPQPFLTNYTAAYVLVKLYVCSVVDAELSLPACLVLADATLARHLSSLLQSGTCTVSTRWGRARCTCSPLLVTAVNCDAWSIWMIGETTSPPWQAGMLSQSGLASQTGWSLLRLLSRQL